MVIGLFEFFVAMLFVGALVFAIVNIVKVIEFLLRHWYIPLLVFIVFVALGISNIF